ncbi:MAG: cytochrome P450 [Anaerolineales bacterium]|nr:cytochrome P450 [Anaerolineales bacterium]
MATATLSPNRPHLKTAPFRKGHPIWGALPEFQKDTLKLFTDVAKMGDVAHIRFGFTHLYQVNHPDGVQHVLQQNNKNYHRDSFGNQLVKLVTGLNLFTSDGDYWLNQRRLMQPAFHRRNYDLFGQIMTDATLRTLTRWQTAIRQGTFLDMHKEMMRLTMEVVGQALFSVDLSDDSNVLGKAFMTSTGYIQFRFNTPLYPPLAIPTRANREVKQAMADVQRILQEMIDERRRTGERKDDLMTTLMEARYEDTGEGMTDEQLRNELGVMIGAGQETTSNLLTWIFHALAANPDVEAKLLDEYARVLGGNTQRVRTPTMADLPRLPYSRMVIDETLRVYPPAWAISTRVALEDDEILGYRIPKGSGVFITPYVLHRDPRFWDAPEKFDPERFTEANEEKRHKYAYLPFGAGPRKCIGNTFALTETQLILATLLPRYKLTLQPGYKVEPAAEFTLRVKGGLPMRVEARS